MIEEKKDLMVVHRIGNASQGRADFIKPFLISVLSK